jgi:hypothetical protein
MLAIYSIYLGIGCNSKMIFQKFIARLNWRQVIIHFIAFWFFSYSFLTFSYLHNRTLIEVARNSKAPISIATFIDNKISGKDLSNFLLWNNLAPLAGLLISFFIALMISKKHHWFWLNSMLAFIACYFLWSNDLLGWNYLSPAFLKPGKVFKNITLEFFSNGLLLLIVGLLVLYLKPVTEFIEPQKMTTK